MVGPSSSSSMEVEVSVRNKAVDMGTAGAGYEAVLQDRYAPSVSIDLGHSFVASYVRVYRNPLGSSGSAGGTGSWNVSPYGTTAKTPVVVAKVVVAYGLQDRSVWVVVLPPVVQVSVPTGTSVESVLVVVICCCPTTVEQTDWPALSTVGRVPDHE